MSRPPEEATMTKKRIAFVAVVFVAAWTLVDFIFASRNDAQPQQDQASANHQQHASVEKKKPKILYWVDPMHPTYKSDKPGIAPDCGMQLTPVYAEEKEPSKTSTPGTVKLSGRKQQLINLKIV